MPLWQSSPQLRELIDRKRAGLSPEQFVLKVSNAYHAAEAKTYDEQVRPDIAFRLAPLLDEFLTPDLVPGEATALDYGCGTGLASELILQRYARRISRLVCSDLSPVMVEHCRANLSRYQNVSFVTGDFEAVKRLGLQFDLIVTCSVLHHIPDLPAVLLQISDMLSRGGHYLAMHEPSARFDNAECLAAAKRCEGSMQRRSRLQWLDPRAYGRKVRNVWRRGSLRAIPIVDQVNAALREEGVVSELLTWEELKSLVELNDPGEGNVGFDVQSLRALMPELTLVHARHYGFLGDTDYRNVSSYWRRKDLELQRRFPEEGANFCTLWRKPTSATIRTKT